jgi:hypothetical protein
MKRSPNTREAIQNLSRKRAAVIPSAEGRGVGTSTSGVADAKALARESARRARRIAGQS